MEAPPPINLALTLQPSFIASKKFIEFVAPHELQQLMESDCIPTNWDLSNYSQVIAKQNFTNAIDQLKGYSEIYCKKYKGHIIKYTKPKHKWGRVFPVKSLGLTSFAKKTRNTLIHKSYYDFDLANAQPEIVRNLCVSNKIPCDIIEKYCNERESIIAEIMTASNDTASRDAVKGLMIRLSFFGTFEGWLKENSIPEFPEPLIVKNYKKQITAIAKSLIQLNSEMYETIKKNKKEKGEDNVIGAFFSTYLQEYELRIVESVLVSLCEKTAVCSLKGLPSNTFIATYEFDGIKLWKENVDAFGGADALLDHMNALLKTAGWDLRFEMKPISKIYAIDFKPAPPPVDKKAEKEEEKERQKALARERFNETREKIVKENARKIADTDEDACEIIYSRIKDRLIVANGVLYYKKEHRWINDAKEIKSNLSYYVIKSGIKRVNDYNQVVPYTQNMKNADAVTRVLLAKVAVSNINDAWEQEMYKSSLGKILFRNGYYDFKKSRFFPFADPDYDHSLIFIKYIDYIYLIPETITTRGKTMSFKDYKADVKRRLFIEPFNEDMANYYILNLAKGLAGDVMKRFFILIGEGDSGKSSITTALANSCGSYFGTFNGNNLCVKKFQSNDEAQALRWIMGLRGCRMIVSNEISSEEMINGEMLKKLASGGRDKIVARGHGGYETEFHISFLPVVFANDIGKIKPMDSAVRSRMRILTYQKTYTDNPSNNLELKADRGLDSEIATNEFCLAFMSLLIDAYKTYIESGNDLELLIREELDEALEDVFEDAHDDFIGKIKAGFELTGCGEDFETNIIIDEWIKKNKLGITVSKFSRDMKKYINLKGVKGIEKAKNERGQRGWKGIKRTDYN
jgi:phage/plasmid-associated DNA primase